jgi:hypothetical protein
MGLPPFKAKQIDTLYPLYWRNSYTAVTRSPDPRWWQVVSQGCVVDRWEELTASISRALMMEVVSSNLPTFQRFLLSPSLGWWWRQWAVTDRRFRGVYCLHCEDDGRGNKHPWNVGPFLSDYMAQHPRNKSSSSDWQLSTSGHKRCVLFLIRPMQCVCY